LINAYRSSAGMAIDASKIIQKTIDVSFELRFEYADMNKIMRLIKEKNIKIIRQEMNMDCIFEISIRKNEAESIQKDFKELRCVKIKVIS
jgi:putative IMPACT (imprinted ancient) family translation regulator